MDKTNLPGFNAEASVYRTGRVYDAGGSDAEALGKRSGVLAQLPRGPHGPSPSCESQCLLAGGSFLQCWLICDPYRPPQWVFA